MLTRDEMLAAVGCEAYGSDGDKIGKVGQVYQDDETDEPAWATVNTGMFGTNESFVPLWNATFSGDRLEVAFPKDTVKEAPNVGDDDGHLTPDQERALYEHYGMGYAPWTDDSDSYVTTTTETEDSGRHLAAEPAQTTTPPARAEAYDTSEQSTDDAMILSEERVQISGTTSQPVGRARLRKVVETEYVTQTIPVRRERIIVEHVPATGNDADDAAGEGSLVGPDIVLNEERPVLEKTVQPVERVRIGTEEYTEQETVTEEVRRERIETDVVEQDRRDV